MKLLEVVFLITMKQWKKCRFHNWLALFESTVQMKFSQHKWKQFSNSNLIKLLNCLFIFKLLNCLFISHHRKRKKKRRRKKRKRNRWFLLLNNLLFKLINLWFKKNSYQIQSTTLPSKNTKTPPNIIRKMRNLTIQNI